MEGPNKALSPSVTLGSVEDEGAEGGSTELKFPRSEFVSTASLGGDKAAEMVSQTWRRETRAGRLQAMMAAESKGSNLTRSTEHGREFQRCSNSFLFQKSCLLCELRRKVLWKVIDVEIVELSEILSVISLFYTFSQVLSNACHHQCCRFLSLVVPSTYPASNHLRCITRYWIDESIHHTTVGKQSGSAALAIATFFLRAPIHVDRES